VFNDKCHNNKLVSVDSVLLGGGGGRIHNKSYIWTKWAHGLYRPHYTLRENNFIEFFTITPCGYEPLLRICVHESHMTLFLCILYNSPYGSEPLLRICVHTWVCVCMWISKWNFAYFQEIFLNGFTLATCKFITALAFTG